MKKIIAYLLVISLALALIPALAEDAGEAAPAAVDAAALTGSWRVCGGTDGYDTLVFHDDGTMEVYAFVDVYQPTDKGLLLFCGAFEVNGADVTLPSGELYHIELRDATEEDDLTIGSTLYTVEPGNKLLFMEIDPLPDDEFGRDGIYVRDYYYPGIPAEEYLVNKKWTLNGEEVTLPIDTLDNGRILYDGKYYSLQCQVLPIPDDMTDEEKNQLGDEEQLMSTDSNTEEKSLYLSDSEIVAYPLDGGEPLLFTMAD